MKIQSLKKQAVRSPHYEAFEGLSPAEFGYLVDGKIGDNERFAEFIQMEQQGIIKFLRDTHGRPTHKLIEPKATLTHIQIELLHPLQGGDQYFAGHTASAFWGNNMTFEKAVCQSLVQKEWIKQSIRASSLGGVTLNRVIVAVLLIFFFTFVTVASFIAAEVGNQTDGPLVYAGVISLALIFITIFVTCVRVVVASYRWRFLLANRIGSGATDKYNEHWEKLYGLAIFLKVSGMDTMTPRYETLSFRDLDALYPYAVALGADEQVVAGFKNR